MAPSTSRANRGGAPRSWVHDYFYDHPGRSSKLPGALASSTYYKAACKKCFDAAVLRELDADAQSNRGQPRSRAQIEEQIWAQETNVLWVQSRPITLANHLKQCPFQDEAVQRKARDYQVENRSPSRGRQWSVNTDLGPIPAQPVFAPQALGLGPHPIAQNSPVSFPSVAHFPLSRSASASSLLLNPPVSPYSCSPQSVGSPLSALDLEFPASQASDTFTPGGTAPSTRKRRRNASQAADQMQVAPGFFSQSLFDSLLARLTASAGLPLRWVENPQWNAFVQTFIPQAQSPSRWKLTNTLIPTEHKIYVDKAKRVVRDQKVTLQCDGWGGLNTHHYIAFRITTASARECFTIKVYDTSSEPKTAEMLLQHIIEVINLLQDGWKVQVIALTTDASGESRRARKDLQLRHPHIVVPDCVAHQINLIVGDYFKADTIFVSASEAATEIIGWLRGKTFLLALLRDVQFRQGVTPLSVLRAVLTRWTAHYLAYSRLIDLRAPLMLVIDNDEKQTKEGKPSLIIKGDAASQTKARKMIAKIKSGVFWHNLLRIKRHLEPLAIAANITQATHTRLDEVLIAFGFLYQEFSKFNDIDELEVQSAVIDSLERRWKKSDQDVFVAAVVLNPLLKRSPFKKLQWNTRSGLFGLFSALHLRFFPNEPLPGSLDPQIREYLEGSGIFEGFENYAKMRSKLTNSTAHNEAWDFWDSHFHDDGKVPLARLAKHLFSICPNSASCERLFSVYGNTLTKLRTRLKNSTLSHLTELKMFLKDEENQDSTASKRLKRSFGDRPSQAGSSQPNAIASSSSAPGATESSDPFIVSLNSPLVTMPAPIDPDMSNPNDTSTTISESATSIAGIVSELTNLCEGERTHEDITFTRRPQALGDLFDFSEDYWLGMIHEKAKKGLDEELELCELLDLDAEGETVDGEEVLTF